MNDIFGIPLSGLMLVLLVLLGVCLLGVALVAWRRPVIFKLGVRNLPRRKAQSILIIVGLMLSTLIISAAIGTGDTLDYSLTSDVYKNLGHVDELVVASNAPIAPNIDTNARIDASTLTTVEGALRENQAVDGIMPLLDAHVAIVNETRQQAEPDLILTGVDPSRLDQFGGLQSTDGTAIDLAAMQPGEVALSQKAADALNASVGDQVTIYYENAPHLAVVTAIADDTYLSGYRRGREDLLEYPGLVMPLTAVQELTGQTGQLSAIAISNTGGVHDGLDGTDQVVEALSPTLTGTGLGVDTVKRYAVDDSQQISRTFTSIFLVLGLFSVMAGLLLIVLIFTMLAAERRSEMGMARAVGTKRGQLIQQFVSEGAGYALLAGLVGSALGVLSSIGIAHAMKWLFGQYVPIQPHVELRSMIVAYSLGVVITFVTIVLASWKVSRLTIVSAIRDLPEASLSHRTVRSLIGGIVLIALGGLLTTAGHSAGTAWQFFMGMSLLPFGVAMVLRYFGAPARLVLSLLGIYILALWLVPDNIGEKLWGKLDGNFEMFFLSGLFMVVGATILTMQNTDILLAGIGKLGRLFKSRVSSVRIAIAYPAASRGRTGMTIAMFSLIIFSLVMMATMSTNFDALSSGEDANAGWDVRADALGAYPVSDFTGTLAANGVDVSGYQATGITTNPSPFSSSIRMAGDQEWKQWVVRGMDESFIDNSTLAFQQRAEGYESDEAIVAALASTPNVAVIDSFAIAEGGLGNDPDQFALTGLASDDKTFAPITVELAGPDGVVHPITIIGIIDQKVTSLGGLYMNQQSLDAIYPSMTSTSYYVALRDPETADATAKSIEAAYLQRGVQGVSIRDELKDQQKESTGFLYLIEGFMGLGLLVGVAAVGVIAFRSIVERRQQIGVLRALGFPRSFVSLSFLIETGFVVAVGSITGMVLGIVLAHNLFTSDDVGSSSASFSVPWLLITVIMAATIVAALVMTWLPSRQAASIAPAEALRYE